MKKTTFMLFALLAGGSTVAHAQYRGRGGNVSLGLKAGASLTNFVGPDAYDTNGHRFDSRFGFHAGIFANIGFARLFAFQPELIYSQKGVKINGADAGIRMHYLDVPLAFHVNTDGFFFEAGPQVGFLLAAQSEAGSVSYNLQSGSSKAYKDVDFGYLAGLGYQLKHGLGAGLRYNGAFSNFPTSSMSSNSTVQTRARNSAFQLYATYSFN
ncbi:hypothetical protein A0257_08800 [Hymenobacter psoromatis]|nr:hypothetical protein A0257_08800 [Hymenobacter psoromatis]